ncbi:MAG TPA: hypothetical protein VN892_03225 [Solirubrobacteraceae bacterium]|nr:hypothetical protein [Solirubrobacteraceae bacterium]
MGLLDDAIREHLELKRRAGAEPGEIARVEREALEPPDEMGDVFDAQSATHDAHYEADVSSVGQETVELDMQAVLDEDAEMTGAADSLGSGHVAGQAGDTSALYSHQEAPLEWGSEPVLEGGTETAEPYGHAEPADDQHQERSPIE